ncbi:MAG: energy transducer TonB [Proteobacteria bacterium]|nr:energy transducer TonB [Desulfobacteraceae bacterium]MBU4013036.1 energy transducer TonB [Pseudomonadota bacterium]MBU4069226.1 energy transducer TonB [Pseudomonadota bacterium]MCG2759312.1 energy transducer TonB [Desulfobacteraceae bacterium]MCG2831536.1 energy transducer TonB [Desulfobacteraceae bacterium]
MKTKPNWLLRGLVSISLGIHLMIFMHIAGVYHSEALTYIELTLKDFSKPPSRNIPRPRLLPKTPRRPKDIKRLTVRERIIPSLKDMKMDPLEKNLPDSLVESISMPDIPDNLTDTGDYVTSNDYFEIVRLRIESRKRYPSAAKTKQIEGRVTVRFVIETDGRISSSKVVESSRHRALDQAALSAVKDASPFPRPPKNLFKGPILLEITIMFELT